MTHTPPPPQSGRNEPTALQVDVKARELHAERWPGRSWDGYGTHRTYWRKQARIALTNERSPS